MTGLKRSAIRRSPPQADEGGLAQKHALSKVEGDYHRPERPYLHSSRLTRLCLITWANEGASGAYAY